MKFICNKNQSAPTESVEELRIAFRHQLLRCVFFLFAMGSVIAIASIAWFVSNSRVNSSVAPISANFDPIKLATRGDRQQAEIDHLNLSEGSTMNIDGKIYYYTDSDTDSDTIALRLNGDNHEISPGSKGKVEFYVIPAGGASSVTLQIGVGGYGEDENDNNAVNPINNDALNALMSGHILLFDTYENGVYSDWLYQDNGSNSGIFNNSITIDLSGESAGVPVAVDFYWIWPLRYVNIANDFTDKVAKFVKTQAKKESMVPYPNSDYSYSRIFFTNQSSLEDPNDRSKAYDMADEYIGSNAQYLYLTIQTSASDGMEGGGQ